MARERVATQLAAACGLLLLTVALFTHPVFSQPAINDDDDAGVTPEFESCTFKTNAKDGSIVEYDISPLKISKRVDLRGKTSIDVNYLVKEHSEGREYDYYLNICEPLQNAEHYNLTTQDAMMVQFDHTTHYLGGVLSNSRITSLADADLRYVMGAGDNRQTTIFLFCADVGLSHPVFAAESISVRQSDYYFVWNTCAACPLGSVERTHCDEEPFRPCSFLGIDTSKTNTVSILVITIVILLVGYLTFGCAYNFVQGKRGLEAVPHHDMFVGCFDAIKAGLVFVFTCGRGNLSAQPQGRNYQNLSTSLNLEDDSDSDLDDDANEQLYG
eukprot:m.11661 g.11661  ORF g.11661 m.11661 type:complete len:328 (+) comp6612_c1_seq1:230-1213(+)